MAEENGPEFVYVKSGFNNNRVVLHEIDPAHPGGSVLVAGDKPTKVGNTAMVRERIRSQWLVEVTEGAEKKKADERLEARMEMIETTLGAGESALNAQFADTREWPGAEPTQDEVMADKAPKAVKEMQDAQPQVPAPPKGDEKARVRG